MIGEAAQRLRDLLAAMPFVAVLRHITPEEIPAIGGALVEEGIRILEVPLNSPRPYESIAALARLFGREALIGAGTVLAPGEVERVEAAGGRLIVMPHNDAEVLGPARLRDLALAPGVTTVSEAFAAIRNGAHALKFFPADMVSPEALRAMKAVLPEAIPALAVGSMTPERLIAYWQAGARGFGLGSKLYAPGDAADLVRRRARDYVAAASRLPR